MIKPQKIWFKLNIKTCEMKEKKNKDRELFQANGTWH